MQIGDTRAPYLDVSVYDVNTVLTLSVIPPTGVEIVKTLTGPVAQGGGVGRWSISAPYTLTSAGPWYERWRAVNAVSGLGAGAPEPTRIDVDPDPPAVGPGQTAAWASVDDYGKIIGGTLPTDLALKLRVATLQLRGEISLDLYVATDPLVLAAMKEACCLQVKYAADNGWDSGRPSMQRSVSIGSVQLGAVSSQAGGSGSVSPIDPLAAEVLAGVGLLNAFVTAQPSTVWW